MSTRQQMMLTLLVTAVLLAAGCMTTETKPVTWKQQSAYMAQVKDPRQFGYSIYQTPAGIDYRDGCRLHPNQAAELPMKAKKPLRPVVILRGNFGLAEPLLCDVTAPSGWLEFDLAQSLGAQPLGENKAQCVKMPGEEIGGCLSVVPTLRLGQLCIENLLVYVRLANGSLGTLARGIEKPEIKGVVGWDLLKKFAQIYLDYPGQRIVFSTTAAVYEPDPSLLVAKLPLVKHAGACAVRGVVDGKEGVILLDPAGDFEVATDGATVVSAIQLTTDLIFTCPAVAQSSGGTRLGARLLEKFRITICPQDGMIYFERPSSGSKE